MLTHDPRIYAAYKPLRNFARKFSYQDACYVAWAFINHFQLKTPLPPDINIPPSLRFTTNRHKIPIYEWELEILLREILINGGRTSTASRPLDWNTLCRGINKIRDLENTISRITNNPENIKVQLFRTAHRQFAWQQRKPSSSLIARYNAIFSQKDIDSLLETKYGLSINELHQIGTMFLGAFLSNPSIYQPIRSDVNELDSKKICRFLDLFSIPVSSLVSLLRREQEFGENFFYSFSSARRYPLIRMHFASRDSVVCPNVAAFTWQMTEGLFYLLCHDSSFGNAYGTSFQKYVGDVLHAVFGLTNVNVVAEEKYGPKKERRDSVDWIVADTSTAVFVECKTKRLSIPAKLALNDTSDLDAQLAVMADAIVQTYTNIHACLHGEYGHFATNKASRLYPLVVTLEDWYTFSDWIRTKLTSRITTKLRELDIPSDYVERFPFSICSIDEFEYLVQVCARHNLEEVIGRKANHPEYKDWVFHSYLAHEFPAELKESTFLFRERFDAIFRALTAKTSQD